MLIQAHVLEGIRRGEVTLAFRRWRRPTVRSGSTLLTPVGQLAIAAVDVVDLRATVAAAGDEVEEALARLRRLDARAVDGAWTARTLAVLRAHPGVRAGDLCHLVGHEKETFKRNVRKLKNLGLSESLGTGYRLSPRGEALLRVLESTEV